MSLILKVQREVNLSLHHKREMQKEKSGLIQLCFDIFLLSVTFLCYPEGHCYFIVI